MMFLFRLEKPAFILFFALLWGACQNPKGATNPVEEVKKAQESGFHKGDAVPNHLVCMVNDSYMGKEQLAVPFEGKTYYGCCAMCQERIPKDKSVRYAIDPHSLKPVSKADAYIVVIGDQGEVAYFENENHYRAFVKANRPV